MGTKKVAYLFSGSFFPQQACETFCPLISSASSTVKFSFLFRLSLFDKTSPKLQRPKTSLTRATKPDKTMIFEAAEALQLHSKSKQLKETKN